MATVQRVYTQRDDSLQTALDTAVEAGLIPPAATDAKKLRALALFAGDHLSREIERREAIAAYEDLAADGERSAVIKAWNEAAAADGLL